MSQFDISRTDDQLTLKHPMALHLLPTGCLLFLLAFLCLGVLGLLGIFEDAQVVGPQGAGGALRFFHPAYNHFGYFWLIGAIVMLFLVPWYVVTMERTALVFRFQRSTDLFLRNNKVVTRIGRIEYICLRERQDPDEAYYYELSVIYADGHEMVLDNSYDEEQIAGLGREIAGFVDARLQRV